MKPPRGRWGRNDRHHAEPPGETYMLVRQGKVQRFVQKDDHGKEFKSWPVARSHEDATRLLRYIGNPPGTSVARVGSFPGETMESHFRLAMKEGCRMMSVVAGWSADGKPEWADVAPGPATDESEA